MKSWRENPDGAENTKATKQIEREIGALGLQARLANRTTGLYWPETPPFDLWKWAARNTKRPDGRGCMSVLDWRKLAVYKNARRPGETHEQFTKRALLDFARFQVKARRDCKLPVPLWVEELLAVELGNNI